MGPVLRALAITAVLLGSCGGEFDRFDQEALTKVSWDGGPALPVAAVQFHAEPLAPERNRGAMERLLREAAGQGAKLVLFHENGLLDYGPRVHGLAEAVPGGPTCVRFAELASELEVWVGIGLAERVEPEVEGDDPDFHITQAYFGPEGYVGKYRKTWLFHNRGNADWDEWAFYDPGDGPSELLELAGLKTATLICADADSRRCVQRLKALGPELVLFPNNRSNFHGPETFAHLAERIGAPVLAANRSGRSRDAACNGGSFLLGADGRTLARANRVGREEILLCYVPLGAGSEHPLAVRLGE